LADYDGKPAAQKGNPSLWSGTAFCGLKAVRPPGNSIGETPDAFAWRALFVWSVHLHRHTILSKSCYAHA